MLHQITRVLTYRASHPVIRKHFSDCRQQNGVIVQYQYRIGPYGNLAPAALRHRFLCHSQRQTDSEPAAHPFPACHFNPAVQQSDQTFYY